MIRYVIAVVFATAMMSVAMPAVGDAAALNGETQIESELAAIEEQANSLLYNEEIPASGVSGATREVTVSFPQESLTAESTTEVVLQQDSDAPVTHVTYHVDGRVAGQYVIDAPLAATASSPTEPVTIEGDSDIDLQLQLEQTDTNQKVVVINRENR